MADLMPLFVTRPPANRSTPSNEPVIVPSLVTVPLAPAISTPENPPNMADAAPVFVTAPPERSSTPKP